MALSHSLLHSKLSEMQLYIPSSPPRSAAHAAFDANRGPWHPSEGKFYPKENLPGKKSEPTILE
jgi:hypothetical protein